MRWWIKKIDSNKIKRIIVFGDSNSFRPEGSRNSWPRLLEAKDPIRSKIFNESCDGRTTRYDVGECNGLGVIVQKLTAHAPIDYVVVMLGTNDVKNKYGPPPLDDIVEGMHLILNSIQNRGAGAIPILLTPPPLGNVNSGELSGARPRVHSVAAEYRRLSKKHNVQLIDVYSMLNVATDLESDMIHLNKIGRKKIADAVWAKFQEIDSP